MHRLDRDPQAPACLRGYQHGRDKWSMESPTGAERGDIWTKLDAMQGCRCAYCEAAISRGKCHIEHFRQRDRYPQGTFEWSNLFGSCDRESTCGTFKDRCGAYPHADLIKPDVEDPDEFLVFDPQGGHSPKSRTGAGQAAPRSGNHSHSEPCRGWPAPYAQCCCRWLLAASRGVGRVCKPVPGRRMAPHR